MDGKRIGPGPRHGDARAGHSAIHVRSREGQLEVTFARGFTQADGDTIKRIPDRKWLRERRMWLLPPTPSVLEALEQSLGSRLVLY